VHVGDAAAVVVTLPMRCLLAQGYGEGNGVEALFITYVPVAVVDVEVYV
jgi:hypothetical protein